MLTIGLGPAFAGGGGGSVSLADWPLTTLEIVVDTAATYLPPVDTSKVTSIVLNCKSLTELPSLDLTNAAKISFKGCGSLKKVDIKTSEKLTSMYYAFHSCNALEEIVLFDTSKATSWNSAFGGCTKMKTFPPFDMSECATLNETFSTCNSLESIELDIPKATSLSNTFYNCGNLRSVKINSPKVTSWKYPFQYCTAIENVDIDMSSTTSITDLFYGIGSRIVELKIKGLGISLPISGLSKLSKGSVLYLFEHAQTLTTSQTITLHPDVFAQLTEDEIAIATEKGFSVVSA